LLKGLISPELAEKLDLFTAEENRLTEKYNAAKNKAEREAVDAEIDALNVKIASGVFTPLRAVDVLDSIEAAWQEASKKQKDIADRLLNGTIENRIELFDKNGNLTKEGKEAVINEVRLATLTKLRNLRRESKGTLESQAAEDRFSKAYEEQIAAKEKAERDTGIARAGKMADFASQKLLAAEDALLKKMGLGAYGEKVRESMGKRRGEAEERFQKGIGSETFLEAAEAAGGGGKRLTGLSALAAAVGGAGKAATRLRREKDTALDKVTEGEERLMLAEDLYKRGRVSEATKMAESGKQMLFDSTIKLKTLDEQIRRTDATIAAYKAKGAGSFRGGADMAKLGDAIKMYTDALADPTLKLPPQLRKEYEQQLKIYKATQARILLQGASIEDRPDE